MGCEEQVTLDTSSNPGNAKKDQDADFGTWDSHMITHYSTDQAIRCLDMPERTGWLDFIVL